MALAWNMLSFILWYLLSSPTKGDISRVDCTDCSGDWIAAGSLELPWELFQFFSGITGDNDGNKENMDDNADQRADRPPRKPRRPNGPRANRGSTVSVFIGGLPRSTRVSQLKVSVREREVQPLAIIWHGGSGHAFLLFPAESEANDALNKLSGLEMNGKTLRVEMAKPRGRRQNSEGDREGDRDGEETEKGSSGEAQVKAEPEPEPAEA